MQNTAPLIESLALLFPESSRNTLKKWIKAGRVFVNNTPTLQANLPVEKGSTISLEKKKMLFKEEIQILYEDLDVCVVAKPEKLLSVASNTEKEKTVHDLLKTRYEKSRVYPVHRLDQDTSGVMLFVLNEEGRDHLKRQFELHTTDREYEVLVEGIVEQDEGIWEHHLAEDANFKMRVQEETAFTKKAITLFKVLYRKNGRTYLKCTLKTGRKNQIRVQAAYSGHPVVGDVKYGAKTNPIGRLGLHASLLGFTHPRSKKRMSFTLNPPKEFLQLFGKV